MKLTTKVILSAFTVLSFALASCNNNTSTETKSEATKSDTAANMTVAAGEKVIYQCPMHPEETSDKPGKCPKCGMDMERVVVKDTVKK